MSSPWRELLPTSLEMGGAEYEIRSDYRAALDICAALSDPELDGQDRAAVLLTILYPDIGDMPREHYEEAIRQGLRFLNGGREDDGQKSPRLVDWEQDFPYIIAPINRVLGQEVRAVEYLHWWTFLAAYQEIGDCTFAQIVRVRDRLARGRKLDKTDQEWYRRSRQLVDFKRIYTEQDETTLNQWLR